MLAESESWLLEDLYYEKVTVLEALGLDAEVTVEAVRGLLAEIGERP